MTKLTTERLEEMRDHYLGMVNKDVGNALTRLLAYEQAAKDEVALPEALKYAEIYGRAFICVDRSGSVHAVDPSQITLTILNEPESALVLPKQPELIGMKVSIDTGSDNIGHRLFGEIVGTSDSNGVPVLCIEVTENNIDVAAPAQPVTPEPQEPVIKHNSVIAEQLAHVLSGMDVTNHQRAVISCAINKLNKTAEILQQNPIALIAPEKLDYQSAKESWNSCRAKMLKAQPVSEPYELPNGWISIDEKMPEATRKDQYFITYTRPNKCFKSVTGGFSIDLFRKGCFAFSGVTHWMPLPSSPAQESE